MAPQRRSDRWGSLGEPADEVRITFLPGASPPKLTRRIAERWAWIGRWVALALSLAGFGFVVSTLVGGLGTGPGGASAPGAAGVAAAYRYPRACLSVTISPADPRYATARLDRASPCWRYGAYVTAVFKRVDGVWRPLREGDDGYSCSPAVIPSAVQEQLGLCRQPLPVVRLPPYYSGSPFGPS